MSTNKNLSIVVLTHNDEERIVDTLECLKFANELIVIDDESQDRTVDLAKQFTTSIISRKLDGNFANQRNFALNHVHNEWVLFVDSDELVSEKLAREIEEKINGNVDGFYIRRIDVMWGKKLMHGEVGNIKLLRLGKKSRGRWHGKVHETWHIKGNKDTLANELIHVPHQSVKDFVKEVDIYSSLRSTELFEKGIASNSTSIFLYPFIKFLRNYIVKRGYKDGVGGFINAMIMSFHSFLVRAKLYHLHNSKK